MRYNDRMCFKITLIIATILVLHMCVTTIRGNTKEDTEAVIVEVQDVKIPVATEQAAPQTPTPKEEPDRYAIFDSMSADWGAEDVEGFVSWEIPEEYQQTGGYMPEKMQIFTYIICKNNGVRYELVLALIERESGYVFDKVGDDGHSKGYMQVYEDYHTDRMERLNCHNLMNPYQNIMTGVDYLAELIEKYGTEQDALAAYNYGVAGAREHLWNNGIYVYDYNQYILQRADEIEEELRQNESERSD